MSDEAKTPTPKRSKRLRNGLLIALAVIVLLPLLLLGVLVLALRSETGTAWVIDQVPGLEVEQGQGSLLGQWQAASLTWQGYGVGLKVESPVVDWSPTCLFNKQLCLERLLADSIDLTLQPSGEPKEDSGDISLPSVDLPLGLVVRDVNLGPFTLNDAKVWDRLQLKAQGSGSDWHLQNLAFVRDDISIDASGRLQTRGDWPLDLEVGLMLPPPYGADWQLALNLTGSAADLRVQGQSSGYLAATLAGRVAPLDSALPAELTVRSSRFVPAEGLPKTLVLTDTVVALKGSLENGFRSDSRTVLPGSTGDIPVSLKGLVTTEGLDGLELVLTGPGTTEAETGRLLVTGNVSWEQALQADAKVSLDAFPWYSLIPDFEQPPVTLRQFNGDVQYQGGAYQASIDASVSGPMGDADMAGDLEGDLESVALTNLRVNTGAGFLGGRADVAFADQLSWDASLTLDSFNPGFWLPALEASLSGDVDTSGRLQEEGTPTLQAKWDLSGSWQANEALIRGALDSDAGNWTLSNLELEVGDNRVTGQGRWGQQINGNLELNLPAPETFLPGLAGSVNGTASVSGTVDQPRGKVTLTGSDLAWQDQLSLSSLDLTATLREGFNIQADLRGKEVRYGEQLLEDLSLALTGTRDDHQLRLNARHKEAELSLLLAGDASESWNAWVGALEQGQISVPAQGQQWTLSESAALEYTEAGKLTLGQHCWQWQQASVCAEDQTLLPTQDIAYRIENFPTTALSPLLPDTLRWDATLNADLQVVMTEDGPDGEVSIDAGSGEFEVQVRDEWESLSYNTFTTRLSLKPNVAELDLQLQGPDIGNLSVGMSVDPDSDAREVDGQFSIEGLDIAMAGIFAGLEVVEGELNGEGTLSGPLMKPAVNGELALSGGPMYSALIPCLQ